MAWTDFAFDPVDGLNDHINGSVDEPLDPRGDIQKFFDQIKEFLNGTLKEKIESIDSEGKLDISGGTMTGILKAQSNTDYTTMQVRNIILSPNDASVDDMQNGEIWIKYK